MLQNNDLPRTPYTVQNRGRWCDSHEHAAERARPAPFILHNSSAIRLNAPENGTLLAIGGVTLRTWCAESAARANADQTRIQAALTETIETLEKEFPDVHLGLLVYAIRPYPDAPLYAPKVTTLRQYSRATGLKVIPLEGIRGGREHVLLVRNLTYATFPKWVLASQAARLIFRNCPSSLDGGASPALPVAATGF